MEIACKKGIMRNEMEYYVIKREDGAYYVEPIERGRPLIWCWGLISDATFYGMRQMAEEQCYLLKGNGCSCRVVKVRVEEV